MFNPTAMPPIELLQEFYEIDPASPSGLSRIKATRGRSVGPVVSLGSDGYYRMKFQGQFYRTHRVVYYLHTGIDPAELVVDHRDGDCRNNIVENLRPCTHRENLLNAPAKAHKADGLPKGISKYGNQFAVSVSIGDGEPGVVLFENIRAATRYADQMRKRYHGEFARSE